MVEYTPVPEAIVIGKEIEEKEENIKIISKKRIIKRKNSVPMPPEIKSSNPNHLIKKEGEHTIHGPREPAAFFSGYELHKGDFWIDSYGMWRECTEAEGTKIAWRDVSNNIFLVNNFFPLVLQFLTNNDLLYSGVKEQYRIVVSFDIETFDASVSSIITSSDKLSIKPL